MKYGVGSNVAAFAMGAGIAVVPPITTPATPSYRFNCGVHRRGMAATTSAYPPEEDPCVIDSFSAVVICARSCAARSSAVAVAVAVAVEETHGH